MHTLCLQAIYRTDKCPARMLRIPTGQGNLFYPHTRRRKSPGKIPALLVSELSFAISPAPLETFPETFVPTVH